MKQFSDLQAINLNLLIKINLRSIVDNGIPMAIVRYNNDVIFDNNLVNAIELTQVCHNILSPIFISIEMKNKSYNQQHETAVIIDSISIDNINIIPTYNHLVDYHNDHKINTKTNYLGYNGKWTLTIDRPFYQWLHQVQGQGWLLS
jgi:hypothetical protein